MPEDSNVLDRAAWPAEESAPATPIPSLFDRIGLWWCFNFHEGGTTPMHGKYICLQCQREHRTAYP